MKLLFALLHSLSIQLESYFTNQQAPFRRRKPYTSAYIIFCTKLDVEFFFRKQFRIDYDDSNDFYDPDQYEEGRNNEIRERVINNLHDEWFKGTSNNEDDIEGIIDYLEPTSYDGFIDLDEEEYNKRRCRLLGMPYIAPLPLIIEQVEITRYSLGPGEVYTKVEVLNMEELPRTRNNIATIRSDIMDKVYETYVDEVM
ncbi:hypothetical protein Tco_1314982 [Tanacetum coccineum]